jgi:hypothetical protein
MDYVTGEMSTLRAHFTQIDSQNQERIVSFLAISIECCRL